MHILLFNLTNRRMKSLMLLLFVLQYPAVFGGRILAIEPHGSKSHWQYMRSILDPLTTRHQVTAITPLPTGGDRENYTEIDASSVFPIYSEMNTVDMIEQFGSVVKMLPLMPDRSHERDICDAFYDFEPVKRMLSTDGDCGYDLILLETFYSSCLSYLAQRLRVPEIYVIPSTMITPMEMLIFNTEPSTSYVSNLMFRDGGVPKSFTQRLTNLAQFAYTKLVPWMTDVRMMYHDPKLYDVIDMRHKPLLVFINTHHITEPPRPFPVNMIQIGGIHLNPPNVLPHDILEFIESSKHGVIFFSFGSVASISTLPKHIQQTFIKVFAQIPQNVLWKYDGDIKNLPNNVMTRKWFPQRDILFHSNVKMFISHGGISGVYEAVDAGVPVLGFPLFYDQPRNVGNLVDAGMALSMDLLTVTEDSFLKTINELIKNEKYTINAKLVSECFKDRPLSASEEVIYWTDNVLRHHESYHFDIEIHNLNWFQYMLMDIITVGILFLLILLYLTYFSFKIVKKYCF